MKKEQCRSEQARVWAVAVLLAVAIGCLWWVSPAVAGEGSDEVSVEMKIQKHIWVFPPQFSMELGQRGGGEPMRWSATDSIQVSTNDPGWLLELSFRAPEAESLMDLSGDWTCTLLDDRGDPISEVLVKGGKAVLPGDGRCGKHRVQVQLSGSASEREDELPARLIAAVTGTSDNLTRR